MIGLGLKRRKESVISCADRARETADWQLAARLYGKALERNPRNPPIWVQYGHALKEMGRLEAAEAAYRRAIAYDPRAANSYLQLGHVLKLQGRTDQATSAYLRAFVLDGSLIDPARELAALEWSEARLAELKEAVGFEAAVPDRPHGSASGAGPRRRRESLITRADRAREAADWQLAARLYGKALERNQRNPPIWVQYGHALKESGRLAEAEKAYRSAICYGPGHADGYLQLGHALKLQGKTEEAQSVYLRAFLLDLSAAAPLHELGGLGWSTAQLSELRGMIASALPTSHIAQFEVSRADGSSSGEIPVSQGGSLTEALDVSQSELDTSSAMEQSRTAWAGRFDPDYYLQRYPDVARAGMDPFDHFLRYGLKEGRTPFAVTPDSRAVTDTEIRCLKTPSFSDEVALFVTHTPDGQLKPHVRHYISSLRCQGINVVLIVAADRLFMAAAGILITEVDGFFVRQNEGYDFAAWAHILRLHPELFAVKILYLINDSLFGPTDDVGFSKLLNKLRESLADVIGLTDNFERGWHLSSYFLAFKPPALLSPTLHKFFHDVVSYKEDAREAVIENYEIRLAPTLRCRPPLRGLVSRNRFLQSDGLSLETPPAVWLSIH